MSGGVVATARLLTDRVELRRIATRISEEDRREANESNKIIYIFYGYFFF